MRSPDISSGFSLALSFPFQPNKPVVQHFGLNAG